MCNPKNYFSSMKWFCVIAGQSSVTGSNVKPKSIIKRLLRN